MTFEEKIYKYVKDANNAIYARLAALSDRVDDLEAIYDDLTLKDEIDPEYVCATCGAVYEKLTHALKYGYHVKIVV